MANIIWRAITGLFTTVPTKITIGHTITAVTAISAFGAAIFFWAATLDGAPAIGYYRLGITMAVAGAVVTWVIRLHNRCQQVEARLREVEAEHAAIKEDAHVRKVIREWRAKGNTPLVPAEDN